LAASRKKKPTTRSDELKPQCGYQFEVKGMGIVTCQLKQDHLSTYHEHRFETWTARHWPPQRHYFTTKPGARLPKQVL